jgi:hypothetical protein
MVMLMACGPVGMGGAAAAMALIVHGRFPTSSRKQQLDDSWLD